MSNKDQLKGEVREAIFHLYHNAEIKWTIHTYPGFHFFRGLLQEGSPHRDCKLLLTPLEAITDEHLIEVCKAFYPLAFEGKCKKDWQCKDTDSDFKSVFHTFNDYHFNIDLKDGELTLYRQAEYDSGGSNVNSIDKIRELGYALPYKGKDLFDHGIAISKL